MVEAFEKFCLVNILRWQAAQAVVASIPPALSSLSLMMNFQTYISHRLLENNSADGPSHFSKPPFKQ
jgi:hypothetical protein